MSPWSNAAARILLAAILVLAPACSRRAERLVGNERLARGPGGLGETTRVTVTSDRDTWVDRGAAVTGPVLLVARTGAFEAVTHLKVARWNIPDTSDVTLSIISVKLFAPSLVRDTVSTPAAVALELGRADAAWDSTTIGWPGPGSTALLGTEVERFLEETLVVDFTASAPLDSLKRWAGNPASVAGLRLSLASTSGPGVAAYRAGALYVRIAYNHTVSGALQSDVIDSPVTEDLYVRTPPATPPAGSETELPLGGVEGTGVALHFPSPAIPDGAAIQEVVLLLPVAASTDSVPFLELGRTVDVEVRTAGATWSETVTGASALNAPTAAIATSWNVAYHGVSDSLLTIRLPASLVRDWSVVPGANHGLLLTTVRAEIAPAIRIESRESARAPRLRVSYTTAPKERF